MSDHCTVAHTYGDEGVGVLSALVAGVHLHLYPEIHLAWRSTKVPCTQEANKTPLLSSILNFEEGNQHFKIELSGTVLVALNA